MSCAHVIGAIASDRAAPIMIRFIFHSPEWLDTFSAPEATPHSIDVIGNRAAVFILNQRAARARPRQAEPVRQSNYTDVPYAEAHYGLVGGCHFGRHSGSRAGADCQAVPVHL